jgi:hypothetical protein
MRATMVVAALAAILGVACSMEVEQRDPGFGVSTQALDGGCECLVVPEMPTIGTRLYFDRYNWSVPLYPLSTTQSAYTIVMPHPTSSTKYLAYGWDPKARRSVFAGEGTTSVSYASLRQRITSDELAAIGAGIITVSWGGSGEIGPGPGGPGPGGPVTDGAAWLAAYKEWKAHEELMDWGTP